MKIDAAFMNLTSSALARVAYDDRCRLLQVEFPDGSVYTYLNVPPIIYHELLNSQSKGRYFNTKIRNAFAHSNRGLP